MTCALSPLLWLKFPPPLQSFHGHWHGWSGPHRWPPRLAISYGLPRKAFATASQLERGKKYALESRLRRLAASAWASISLSALPGPTTHTGSPGLARQSKFQSRHKLSFVTRQSKKFPKRSEIESNGIQSLCRSVRKALKWKPCMRKAFYVFNKGTLQPHYKHFLHPHSPFTVMQISCLEILTLERLWSIVPKKSFWGKHEICRSFLCFSAGHRNVC